MQRIEVRYVHFPATERGILGFKMGKNDSHCVEPNIGYPLDNPIGCCHIDSPEKMDELAIQVGAKTRLEFIEFRKRKGFKTWLNAYSLHLSNAIGNILQSKDGLKLNVNEIEVTFYCPEGKFIAWGGKEGS